MESAPKPTNEHLRLHTLRALQIMDTPCEERFDRLTRLAQRLFNVPIALVTLIDEDRQWFKSKQGLTISETPRDISFCAHTIHHENTLVVPDTLADARFRDNPLVNAEPKIRFYAGQPLLMPNGAAIGVMCLIDRKPRSFSAEDHALLRDLAQIAEDEFAAIRLATMDDLTGLSNRRGFEMLAAQTLTICQRLRRPASLLFFDMDSLKTINDDHGHSQGDLVLSAFADLLRATCREADLAGRLGGDEFAVLLSDATPTDSEQFLARLRRGLERRNSKRGQGHDFLYSVGRAGFDPALGRQPSIADLLRKADRLMYKEKRAKQSGARNISTEP